MNPQNGAVDHLLISYLDNVCDLFFLAICSKSMFVRFWRKSFANKIVIRNLFVVFARFKMPLLNEFSEFMYKHRLVLTGSAMLYSCYGTDNNKEINNINVVYDALNSMDFGHCKMVQTEVFNYMKQLGFVCLKRNCKHWPLFPEPNYFTYSKRIVFVKRTRNVFQQFPVIIFHFTNRTALDVVSSFDFEFTKIIYRGDGSILWSNFINIVFKKSTLNAIIVNNIEYQWCNPVCFSNETIMRSYNIYLKDLNGKINKYLNRGFDISKTNVPLSWSVFIPPHMWINYDI
jgi:hypothetical protein